MLCKTLGINCIFLNVTFFFYAWGLYQLFLLWQLIIYYDGGGWRATWEGEGGGVLINQCPHNLDIWQYVCGMPSRLTAQMGFGKYHDIEVEDDLFAGIPLGNKQEPLLKAAIEEITGTQILALKKAIITEPYTLFDRGFSRFDKNKREMLFDHFDRNEFR